VLDCDIETHGVARRTARAVFNEWMRVIHPEDVEAVARTVTDAVHRAQHYTVDYRICLPDAQQRWVRVHGQPTRNQPGV